MHCEPKWKFGMIGTLYFFGYIISSFILLPLADNYGRKKVYLFGLSMFFCYIFGLLFMKEFGDISYLYLLIFLLGFSASGR
jgi:MFS family permease